MGGTTLAKDVVFRALRAGKDVVTANKALIADCLPEIEAVVAEANAAQGAGAPRVQFGYEAAVCGGIPIIHTMNTAFVGDEVTRLRGIMNGCTNFMLTKMEAEGLSYADCLAEATALGYAEEDPTLDVGGFDARSKLAILVRLAFGVDVDETLISCTGIAGLETIDFEYARGQLDGTIKLLGVAELDGAGGLTAYVTPALVPRGATLASISDATNAVEVASRVGGRRGAPRGGQVRRRARGGTREQEGRSPRRVRRVEIVRASFDSPRRTRRRRRRVAKVSRGGSDVVDVRRRGHSRSASRPR